MLIFGYGKRTFRDRGPGREETCPVCGYFGRFFLMEGRVWFTLFFIPFIPYGRVYVATCPNCKNQFELTKSEFDAALES